MPGATGTLTLYVDDQEVGRDDASPVTPDYDGPFSFTGGTIDKVVVDVSGERYVAHRAQVRGWFMTD
jgi:arylsulfatase